jgi:catechol 2,3-dioxygenase-like lactoylglutathione lyase family enzyme
VAAEQLPDVLRKAIFNDLRRLQLHSDDDSYEADLADFCTQLMPTITDRVNARMRILKQSHVDLARTMQERMEHSRGESVGKLNFLHNFVLVASEMLDLPRICQSIDKTVDHCGVGTAPSGLSDDEGDKPPPPEAAGPDSKAEMDPPAEAQAAVMPAKKISCVTLRLHPSQLEETRNFYVSVLGMRDEAAVADAQRLRLGFEYAASSCGLEFMVCESASKPYSSSREDIYWKIGIVLHDVEAAAAVLAAKGVTVGKPSQFHDIGFLCHIADQPHKFTIELLQTTFESNADVRNRFVASEDDRERFPLLQAAPVIGQITTRITDPERSLEFYTKLLGMKLLSIQRVDQYEFVLYFLAFTDDEPPQPDQLESVANREWLWQRPYTVLELQHRLAGSKLRHAPDDEVGFVSFTVQVAGDFPQLSDRPSSVTDPDGCKIAFEYV